MGFFSSCIVQEFKNIFRPASQIKSSYRGCFVNFHAETHKENLNAFVSKLWVAVFHKKLRPAAQNPPLKSSSHYSATAICLADQRGPIQGGSARLNAERTTLWCHLFVSPWEEEYKSVLDFLMLHVFLFPLGDSPYKVRQDSVFLN